MAKKEKVSEKIVKKAVEIDQKRRIKKYVRLGISATILIVAAIIYKKSE